MGEERKAGEAVDAARALFERLGIQTPTLRQMRVAVAALREAERTERERCVQACMNEYGRWRDAEGDSRGIAIGAIAAASNILCAIERIPSLADVPVNDNESCAADVLRGEG